MNWPLNVECVRPPPMPMLLLNRMGCCASMGGAISVAAEAIVARTKGVRIAGLLRMSEIVGLS
jgi:hypothetical protein